MSVTRAYRGGYDGRPGWWLSFPFQPEQIERLKRAIPWQDRAWIETRREWWVSQEHEQELCRILPGFEAYLAQGSLF